MKGYCMKCKKMSEMMNSKELTKKGRRFAQGSCGKCKTKMFKILPKKK